MKRVATANGVVSLLKFMSSLGKALPGQDCCKSRSNGTTNFDAPPKTNARVLACEQVRLRLQLRVIVDVVACRLKDKQRKNDRKSRCPCQFRSTKQQPPPPPPPPPPQQQQDEEECCRHSSHTVYNYIYCWLFYYWSLFSLFINYCKGCGGERESRESAAEPLS